MNTHVGILSSKAVFLTHVQESGCIFQVDFEKARLRTAQEGVRIRLASPDRCVVSKKLAGCLSEACARHICVCFWIFQTHRLAAIRSKLGTPVVGLLGVEYCAFFDAHASPQRACSS